MQLKFGLTLTVLLALLAKGHSQLQCYVCDNCDKIDKNTPLQMCGGDAAPATPTMTPTPTTSAMTTTTEASTTEGTSSSTAAITTEETTMPPTKFPTPATVGPISSTTSLPTPPSVGTVIPYEIELPLNNTASSVNSTSNFTLPEPILFVTPEEPATTLPPLSDVDLSNETTPSTLLVRQRRNIPENGVTYHCYKVQKKYDNIYGTQRGCMAVQTQQSVCGELKAANNNQIQKCKPCSKSKCNGSSTIGVSIGAVLVALLAVIIRA